MPQGKTLDEHLLDFSVTFPFGADVLKLLRASEARAIWGAPVRQSAPSKSWQLHVRMPRHLEEHFGFTRQFLMYCLASDDLQPRDATRIRALIRDASSPIEPDFALLVAEDASADTKLGDWAMERQLGITIVPIHRAALHDLLNGDEPHLALRTFIERWISAHNLYDERDPVTGDRFFGRGELLRNLDRKLAQGRGHVGIFGLRRIGKTSLVLELRNRLQQRADIVPLWVDLESTSGAGHAAQRISEELAIALAEHSSLSLHAAQGALRLHESGDGTPTSEISRMADRVRSLLTTGAFAEQRVVLLLDEAEILLPKVEQPAPFAIDLFRALRGVSQETQRLNLVLAGVNASPTESPLLGEEDNPLFGLLSVEYLGPLAPAECIEMIRKVGRKMQVRWDGPGVEQLVADVGGHPLLARLSASDLVTRHSDRPLRPTTAMVDDAQHAFPRAHGRIFEQMMVSLRRYYPEELDVLEVISGGDFQFANDLIDDNPSILNHLIGYGVVDRDTMRVAIPAFERWLRGRHAE